MADRVFAIASFLAVFAVGIAIVQFAGPKPPLALDGQTYVLPISLAELAANRAVARKSNNFD